VYVQGIHLHIGCYLPSASVVTFAISASDVSLFIFKDLTDSSYVSYIYNIYNSNIYSENFRRKHA
jgi:hypothetical protein